MFSNQVGRVLQDTPYLLFIISSCTFALEIIVVEHRDNKKMRHIIRPLLSYSLAVGVAPVHKVQKYQVAPREVPYEVCTEYVFMYVYVCRDSSSSTMIAVLRCTGTRDLVPFTPLCGPLLHYFLTPLLFVYFLSVSQVNKAVSDTFFSIVCSRLRVV